MSHYLAFVIQVRPDQSLVRRSSKYPDSDFGWKQAEDWIRGITGDDPHPKYFLGTSIQWMNDSDPVPTDQEIIDHCTIIAADQFQQNCA